MTTDRDENARDEARRFERLLLDSARADALPHDVSGAWARFGASLASVAELSAAGTVATGVRTLGQASSARGGGAHALALRFSALKWLLVGALTGSALTALGMSRIRDWRSGPAAPTAQVSTVAVVTPPVASVPSATIASISADLGVASAVPITRRTPFRTRRDTPLAHSRSSSSNTDDVGTSGSASATEAQAQSTLSAQVALLDAARTASAAGAFGEALSVIERYQAEFPSGELAPDAEVVALEALAAQGDSEALAGRAARFLARYPGDPHVARVKELAKR